MSVEHADNEVTLYTVSQKSTFLDVW